MDNAITILKKYWGYDTFREPQQLIIQDVVEKKDTLALLPTGGGKSICFQVPAMMQEGLCLVISPLIALMRDQVAQLKSKGIKAAALFSGMSIHELEIVLNNAVLGYYKFLYVSPERLQSDLFVQKLAEMSLNLIAVDEAHCISQWGHDFRPSYRLIAIVRKIQPNINIIALTASATPKVQEDIKKLLLFKDDITHAKSFLRDNLSFICREVDIKLPKVLEAIQKIKGCSMVYVRNRQKTKEIADFLLQNNINASYYHAGLSHQERNKKQEEWLNNKVKVMCCTNAFGMGIDKADVRLVIHYDLPDAIESYYQEAGRAGRDGKHAFAYILYNTKDLLQITTQIESRFPSLDQIKNTYNAIFNYLKLAYGSGKFMTFDFELYKFARTYKLEVLDSYYAIKILEEAGYFEMSESFHMPSRAKFLLDNFHLYKYQVENIAFENIIKFLLRSYGGIIDNYAKINEKLIANKLNISTNEVVKKLEQLDKNGILNYVKASDTPKITILEERLHIDNVRIDMNFLNERKSHYLKHADAFKNYLLEPKYCRQQLICRYFGELDSIPCGICDNCKEQQNISSSTEYESLKKLILDNLMSENLTVEKILLHFKKKDHILVLQILRILLDEKLITLSPQKIISIA